MQSSLFRWLLAPTGLTPHGFCLLWEPGLLWTYALADLATGTAYFVIPVIMILFIRRRRDLELRFLFWLFAAFILLCGITHWLDVVTLWVAAYGLQAVAKAATACVSVVTAIMLWRLLPQALALPSVSQLQTANDALRKAEDFLTRVSCVAGIGGWEVDLSNGSVSWSEEVRRIRKVAAGYEPTLEAALDFYAPEAQPVIRAAIDRAITHGEGWDLELQVIRADGRRIWIHNVGSAEFADGKATRLVGALQDVTDRVMQRMALEEARERVELATDGGGVGLWEWEVTDGGLVWSAGMYWLHGLNPQSDAPSHRSWLGRVHPDDREIVGQALQRGVEQSTPFDIEYRVSWDDGSLHYLRTRGRLSRDSNPCASRMVGACWDITHSRELVAEVARRAELQAAVTERETAIFRNSADTLFVVRVEETGSGLEFIYETFSPAFEQLTGRHPEQMVGQRPDQCLPPESADLVVRRYSRCVAERITIAYVETHVTPLGARELEGSITPVTKSLTDRIVRIVGTVRDVTERNRMEAALRQAQKLEAIGRLSAGVAHDFNNILQGISGGLEIILQDVGPHTRAHKYANVSLNAAMRGAHLTHHLLSYARKQMLRPQSVEVSPFLAEMQILLSRTLGPHIAVHVDADPILSVFVDPGQLQTAILNLAINASHAMQQGGKLQISAREEGPAGQRSTVLAISDTGTGMDAFTLSQAVEPFFSTKGLEGSGLGLSMVQGFVEQSGGKFSLISTLGQGTTAEIRLPADVVGDEATEAPPRLEEKKATGSVLLVDDTMDVLVTIGAFLENASFVVKQVKSGDEALALLATGKSFDLLVTDYAMPGLNGVDLINEALIVQPGLKALLITGYSDISNRDTLAESVPILRKPFRSADLVAAVRRLIEPNWSSPDGRLQGKHAGRATVTELAQQNYQNAIRQPSP